MAFKAEELMIQVLPREGENLGTPDDAKCQGCLTQDTRKHCSQKTKPCGDSPHGDPCHNNNTRRTQGGVGPSGLVLLRHQMREFLSQELPC